MNDLNTNLKTTETKKKTNASSPANPAHNNPKWFDGRAILEDAFCQEFLQDYPMRYVNGTLFTVNGRVDDEEMVKKVIFDRIKSFVHVGLSKKVTSLFTAIQLQCKQPDFPIHTDRIHLANGTLFIPTADMLCFRPEKEFCRNRLAVGYYPEAFEPVRWKSFLADLLYEEDIVTLQEFMGYCLLPVTRAQKMLIIVGRGGEGKSRIGVVLHKLFGKNILTGNLLSLESNRFSKANLENILVFVDDDMQMEALPSTNNLKTLVTAETTLELEKKGVQGYQGKLYTRLIAFGNGSLHALYDRSEGFFRRQILLRTKDKAPERIDDTALSQKLDEELEGIFLWCLEGLCRLMRNHFHFTISERAQNNLMESIREGNNIVEFLESTGYIRFREDAASSSRELYAVYKGWCDDNTVTPLAVRTFSGYLKENLDKYDLRYDTNIPVGQGKHARGFHGIECARLGRFED